MAFSKNVTVVKGFQKKPFLMAFEKKKIRYSKDAWQSMYSKKIFDKIAGAYWVYSQTSIMELSSKRLPNSL